MSFKNLYEPQTSLCITNVCKAQKLTFCDPGAQKLGLKKGFIKIGLRNRAYSKYIMC